MTQYKLETDSLEMFNLKIETSEKIEVEVDKEVYDYILELRENLNHKHITTGTLIHTMIMVTDSSFTDSQTEIENRFDDILRKEFSVDVEKVNNLSKETSIPHSDDTERLSMFLPTSITSELPYFKSEYIETVIRDFDELYWSSRNERLNFKSDLIKVFEADGEIETVDVNSSTQAALDNHDVARNILDQRREWYIGKNPKFIEDNITEYTKQTMSDRVPPLQYLFDKKVSHFKTQLNEVNGWDNVEKLFSIYVEPDESLQQYIQSVLDVSEPTAEKYLKQLETNWNESNYVNELCRNNKEKVYESFVLSQKDIDEDLDKLLESKVMLEGDIGTRISVYLTDEEGDNSVVVNSDELESDIKMELSEGKNYVTFTEA